MNTTNQQQPNAQQAQETTSLLTRFGAPTSSQSSSPFLYGCNEGCLRNNRYKYILLVSCLALILVSSLFVLVGIRNNNNNHLNQDAETQNQESTVVVSPRVFSDVTYKKGPDFTCCDTNTTTILTFQELALRLNMTYRYQQVKDSLDETLTANVSTCQVYGVRKTVLKFRDLLDVLSPIYPTHLPHHRKTKNKTEEDEDLWLDLRDTVSEGYELLGTFLDLCHAKIQQTPEQTIQARTAVLEWKRGNFDAFVQRHLHYPQDDDDGNSNSNSNDIDDIAAYLSQPSLKSFRRESNSHLFWREYENDLPSGSDNAREILRRLAHVQTQNALLYLNQVIDVPSVLPIRVQDVYHNLRKELRSLTDEYELLGGTIFDDKNHKNDDDDNDKIMALLFEARSRLGDLNDLWTARQFYIDHNHMLPDKQKQLTSQINAAWSNFQEWSRNVQLAKSLETLARSLTKSDATTTTTTTHPKKYLR